MPWAQPRLNIQPFEFFAQLYENALFFCIYQLHKYQTLLLVDCIVFSQIPGFVFAFLQNTGSCKQSALKFGYTQIWLTIKKRLKKLFCYIYVNIYIYFSIFKFSITFAKNHMKKKNVFSKFQYLTKINVLETVHCKMMAF